MAEKREIYATYAIYASANLYKRLKWKRRFFYLSKMTKNESKILLSFTKDAKEAKVRVYKKWYETMGLWDFKVS